MFECIINVGSSAKNDVQVFFLKKSQIYSSW